LTETGAVEFLTLRLARGLVGHEYCMQNSRPQVSNLS
jgi:hypothetical protein